MQWEIILKIPKCLVKCLSFLMQFLMLNWNAFIQHCKYFKFIFVNFSSFSIFYKCWSNWKFTTNISFDNFVKVKKNMFIPENKNHFFNIAINTNKKPVFHIVLHLEMDFSPWKSHSNMLHNWLQVVLWITICQWTIFDAQFNSKMMAMLPVLLV